MSGGKGGSTTSSVQIPDWAQDAAKKNIAMGEYASQLGYMPYYGLDVAAQTPAQQAANQNFGSAVSAFGGQAPVDMNAGMPTTQTIDGVTGYSSGGLFDSALAELQQRRPAQYEAYSGMFMDPVTGEQGVMFTPTGSVASETAPESVQRTADYSSSDSGVQGRQGDYYDFISSAPVEWLSKNFGEPTVGQAIVSPIFSALGAMARDKVTDYYNPAIPTSPTSGQPAYTPVIPVSAGGSYDDYNQFNQSDSGSSDMTGYTGGKSWSSDTVSNAGGNLSGGYTGIGGW